MERAGDRRRRGGVIASLAALGIAVLLGAFLLGSRMRAEAAAQPGPTRSAAARAAAPALPSPTPTRSLGPADLGPRAWDAMRGGECLGTFGSPWRLTYRVVACRSAHAAQLTRVVPLRGDRYPGRTALRARLGTACDGAVRLSAASRYRDLRVTSSYPTTAGWARGDRTASCFAFRAGGGPLLGSVATTAG